jgi:hypothetical protein
MERRVALGYTLAVSILMVFSMVYGFTVSHPDNVYTRHGLPVTWGRHQLVTIAGPADAWVVNLNAMLGDLVIWLAILVTPQLLGCRPS